MPVREPENSTALVAAEDLDARSPPLGICGRVDLLRALESGMLKEMAELLGYSHSPVHEPLRKLPSWDNDFQSEPPQASAPFAESSSLEDVPFWRVEAYTAVDTEQNLPSVVRPSLTPTFNFSETLPEVPPLVSFPDLLPRLRRAAAEFKQGAAPDIPALLRRIGRGKVLDQLPRRKRRRWGAAVRVIEDRSEHLIPYRSDQALFCEDIARHFAVAAMEFVVWPGSARKRMPPPGVLVIALTDLGCLTRSPEPMQDWLDYGRDLRAAGCRPVALLPGALSSPRLDPLRRLWEMVSWDTPVDQASCSRQAIELHHLFLGSSPAVRIEPGFLRALRLLHGQNAPGAEIEAEFYQSPLLVSRHSVAATLDPAEATRLQREFASEDKELCKRVLELLRQWRGGLKEVWFEEIVGLDKALQALIDPKDLQAAYAFFARMADRLSGPLPAPIGCLYWFSGVTRRLPEEAWKDERLRLDLMRCWWGTFRDDPNPPQPPPGFDPALLPHSSSPRRRFSLRQHDKDLVMIPEGENAAGSLLGAVESRNGEIVLEPLSFWKSGLAPGFADDWGWDKTGPWMTFSIGDLNTGLRVSQRMRWINPGRFLMGSPGSEPERFNDEGPQHEVTISQGFWLFDTACTQALWQAIMGDNPSRSKDPSRPVENVSWVDAQVFLSKINNAVPGLNLSLPNEAQWEYACRAGTTTAFSFGANITPEQVNYNGNHPYPGGAKGLNRQETVPVGSLPANPWGLYEMHGNVWEWCGDGTRTYEAASIVDPIGPMSGDALRVLRGGAWDVIALHVRSANRFACDAGNRVVNVGFRCARVQDGAEPEGKLLIRQAERRIGASLPGARIFAKWREDAPEARAALLLGGPFVIRTDCERLMIGIVQGPPPWASAMGRDSYGLWTEFTFDDVIQRMRWINPGRFLMGSPESEPERYDDEGPQHEVTISQGFWLFDTACTQALWQAIMGDNPSRFKNPTRPVERVRWNDVQQFLRSLNDRVPGLNLSLPSEAQWEYACRAGTETPFSFGANITPELVNYNGDYPYPGGAKGLNRQETVPVGSLPANPWGLYEMHGNVLEWCADGIRSYGPGAMVDPIGPMSGDAPRVLRGGAWGSHAQRVRSAVRGASDADNRSGIIGFRCARVQDGAEPERKPLIRQAERRNAASLLRGRKAPQNLKSRKKENKHQQP